ncbi:hypothetical protein [Brevundimonas sp.]|uniref:hypothetical protein n=1 Tax=Brevundimonas sp. TaxID=1871086 RepID=UPI002D63CD5E|nr:hypothetical protein [Brevundimonas sp.]HYC75039.1 hypothetical protein [Brevundimonas sp.]
MSISRNLQAALAAAALAGAAAAPVVAQDAPTPAPAAPATRTEAPVVVARDANGRATSVRIGGTVYKVCMSENEDGCIQPRDAGLNWGDRPLAHWPGRPASETSGRTRAPAATPG